ncbi:hypothetical protein QQG55_25005 [Brugia pahangi]
MESWRVCRGEENGREVGCVLPQVSLLLDGRSIRVLGMAGPSDCPSSEAIIANCSSLSCKNERSVVELCATN